MTPDISPYLPSPATLASLQPYIAALDWEIECCFMFDNVTEARRLIQKRRRVFVNLTGVTPELFLALFDTDN